MVTASFSIHNLEFLLLILARVSALIYAAPFFNMRGVPGKAKVGLAFFLSIIIANITPYYDLEYDTVVGFAILVGKEVLAGLALGFSANLAMYTISFAGQLIDIDIGFSMVQLFDPLTNQETSAFGSFYTYIVMLVMMILNMHYYVITAIVDSFKLIPIGQEQLHANLLYHSVISFATQYYIVGFRIILPIFISSLLLNIILGILAKTAPQMNMFVVGMQLKVLIGLAVLLVVVICIPNITQMVYELMQNMVDQILKVISTAK